MNNMYFRFIPTGHPTFDVVVYADSYRRQGDEVFILDTRGHTIAHVWLDNGKLEVMGNGQDKLILTAETVTA